MRQSTALLLSVLLLFGLTACGGDNTQQDASNPGGETSAAYAYEAEDLDQTWNEADAAARITLDDAGSTIDGTGVTEQDGIVTITAGGDYILRGTLTDGQVRVEAGKDDLVRLVLDGVTIHCEDSAAIYAVQADKTVVLLAEGSENALSDGREYNWAEGEDAPDATLYAQDNLSITGSGALNVEANFLDGICSKDTLVITGGAIVVAAVDDGLHGRDGIAILDGTLAITAGNDGLKANNDTDADKGFVVLDGAALTIHAACDGVQAETKLTVTGGEHSIQTGGGAAAAPAHVDEQMRGRWMSSEEEEAAEEVEQEESHKGLKAGSLLEITGGVLTLDTQDDALHVNGDCLISGGVLTLLAGDDGIHADGNLTINGGIIEITGCYEGLEGAVVEINDGEIRVKASDDGINAADVGAGEQMPMQANENLAIRINGGSIYLEVGADGIDSNGGLYITGGTTVIHGPESGPDSALDMDGAFEITGGELVGLGVTQMAREADAEASTQPSLNVVFNQTQAAGGQLRLEQEDGQVVMELTAVKGYQLLTITSEKLVLGESYSLYLDEAQLFQLTLESMVTTVAEDGSAQTLSGGFGGGGRPGGMERPEGMEFPEGMERPEGMEFPEGMERPEGMEFPEGMQRPEGEERPDGMQPSRGGELPSAE